MDLNSWDIASALSLSAANAQLLASRQLTGAEFKFTYAPAGVPPLVLQGSFASWQLVGGSNNLVSVAITLANATGTQALSPPVAHNLSGTVVTLEIPLSFVASTNVPLGTAQQTLCFDFTTTGGVPSQQGVNVQKVALPAGAGLDAGLVGLALLECVANNAASTSFVFATLVSAQGLPAGASSFGGGQTHSAGGIYSYAVQLAAPGAVTSLKDLAAEAYRHNEPVLTQYQFLYAAASGNKGEDYLVVLASLSATTPLPAAIDGQVFGSYDRPVCLAFSPDYFFPYIIMPQLPPAYNLRPGTWDGPSFIMPQLPPPYNVQRVGDGRLFTQSPDIGRFSYDEANKQVVSTGSIDMPSVSAGGISYSPRIDDLTVTIDGSTHLRTVLHGSCHISSGVNLTFTYACNNPPVVSNNALVFAPDPNPSMDHDVDMTWEAKIGNEFTGDLLIAIVNAIGKSITHSISNNLASFGLAQLSPTFVRWADCDLQVLDGAGMNDILFLRGRDSASEPAPAS